LQGFSGEKCGQCFQASERLITHRPGDRWGFNAIKRKKNNAEIKQPTEEWQKRQKNAHYKLRGKNKNALWDYVFGW
jgi:hypothetical protein